MLLIQVSRLLQQDWTFGKTRILIQHQMGVTAPNLLHTSSGSLVGAESGATPVFRESFRNRCQSEAAETQVRATRANSSATTHLPAQKHISCHSRAPIISSPSVFPMHTPLLCIIASLKSFFCALVPCTTQHTSTHRSHNLPPHHANVRHRNI